MVLVLGYSTVFGGILRCRGRHYRHVTSAWRIDYDSDGAPHPGFLCVFAGSAAAGSAFSRLASSGCGNWRILRRTRPMDLPPCRLPPRLFPTRIVLRSLAKA